MTKTGRALGVDFGSRRIGLALSDPTRTVASPSSVLERSGDRAADHRAIKAAADEAEATTIVVGYPLSLSGKVGPAAQALGGNVGKGAEVIAGGGKNVDAVDVALGVLREQAAAWQQ